MNETINLLMRHRSIRKYKDTPISEDVVKILISCGQAASTSSHWQQVTVIEVRDPQLRARLARCAGDQAWVIQAPLVLVFCADLHRASVYFNESLNRSNLSNTESYTVAVIDTAIAAQNVMIAAESMGLGGVYIGGIRNEIEEVAQMLCLPTLTAPLFGMCLGVPDQEPGLKPRLPLEIIRKIDCYNETNDAAQMQNYDNAVCDYYKERTRGKEDENWTCRSAKAMMAKPRENVGPFLRKNGFLHR